MTSEAAHLLRALEARNRLDPTTTQLGRPAQVRMRLGDRGPRQIPVLAAAAFAIALSHEKSWVEAVAETGSADYGTGWPEGYCNEASIGLADDLHEKLPEAGAEYVWGRFVADPEHAFGHAWVALRDGTIIDLTAGQFFASSGACHMILPGERAAGRYREQERKPPYGVERLRERIPAALR